MVISITRIRPIAGRAAFPQAGPKSLHAWEQGSFCFVPVCNANQRSFGWRGQAPRSHEDL
eukprot:3243204-Lingulodinium_polyedra.AAC.1